MHIACLVIILLQKTVKNCSLFISDNALVTLEFDISIGSKYTELKTEGENSLDYCSSGNQLPWKAKGTLTGKYA